jgi:HK97 gp10 family phage protein
MADRTTVEGLAEIEKTLRALTEEVAYKATRHGALAGAEVFRKEASRKASRGDDQPITAGKDKGKPRTHLFESIIKRVVKDAKNILDSFVSGSIHIKIRWSKRAYWGLFNEFGTSKMAAQPFMRPAFDTKRREALDAFIAAIRAGIRKYTK